MFVYLWPYYVRFGTDRQHVWYNCVIESFGPYKKLFLNTVELVHL